MSGGDEVAEYAGLSDWLAGERALAGRVRLVRAAPGEGEMGGVFDMLAVALGSGGAAVALANSLTAWIRTRQRRVSVTVEGPSGRVTLTSDGPADMLPLLEQILREPGEQ